MNLKNIRAFKILNSRAQATIAVSVTDGKVKAGAPEGASEGKMEFPSFPRGVDVSINIFNKKVAPKLAKLRFEQFSDFAEIERVIWEADGTKSLGGGPVVALEFALLKVLAIESNKEIWQVLNPKASKMPLPLGNVIGGGAHAGRKSGDIQENLLCPQTKTFTEAAFINASIYYALKKKLEQMDPQFTGGKTDEGAWITRLPAIETINFLSRICKLASRDCKSRINLGIDLAASQLFKKGKYLWENYSKKMKGLALEPSRHFDLVLDLIKRFGLWYVEDPFVDAESFARLTESVGKNVLICADDLTCTNPDLLKKVLELKAANAVIVKPNQVGSLVKAKEFFDLAKKNKLKTVVSHRSGDLPDSILAHIAFAWEADYVKFGVATGERVAKINELIGFETLR